MNAVLNKYRWHGIDVSGEKRQGLLEAQSENHAREMLFKQGVAVLALHLQKRQRLRYFLDHLFPYKNALALFFSHLALLLKSGLTLVEALEIVIAQTRRKNLRQALREVEAQVRRGASFSDALGKSLLFFNSFHISLLRVGEKVGNLPVVLHMLGDNLAEQIALEKKVQQAALLPLFTCLCAVFIMGGIFVFVIPQFETFFNTFERSLPQSTVLVMTISHWLRSPYAIIATLGCLGAIGIIHAVLAKNVIIKRYKDHALFLMGTLSTFFIMNDIIRYFSALSLLIKAGVSLYEALVIAQSVVKNKCLEKKLADVSVLVKQGQSLSAALSAVTRHSFPDQIQAQIAVGERTGKLGCMLEKAVHAMIQDHKQKLRTLVTFVQPALLITLGLALAFLMMAVYLPLFDMVALV